MNNKQKFFIFIASLVIVFLFFTHIFSQPRSGKPISYTTPPYPVHATTSKTVEPSPQEAAATQTPYLPRISPTKTTAAPEDDLSFYVSPDGRKENNGSKQNPWPLQYALNQPAELLPGSTVWIRGGIYSGTFVSHLKGAEGKPIVIRAYPGERAILQNDSLVLDISTSYFVNFWGLEITSTESVRDPYERSESAYGIRINQGKRSHDIKFINMMIHDMPAQGMAWWRANTDSEVYGSLIFFNGANQFDHGIYVNNVDGRKLIEDNIIFDNASHGIHAYGSSEQELNNIQIIGNTVFNNGSIGYSTTIRVYGIFKRNILLGGGMTAQNPVVSENLTYYESEKGTALNLGYKAGSMNGVVENNYFGGGKLEVDGKNNNLSMEGNLVNTLGFASISNLRMMGNAIEYDAQTPVIFVRPNRYEKGRANITIYNWSKEDHVTILAEDLVKTGLKQGDQYELHNVQDYFTDIIRGTYDGKQIIVPMTGHSVAQPKGLDFKPASTFPEFGSFVLLSVNEPAK